MTSAPRCVLGRILDIGDVEPFVKNGPDSEARAIPRYVHLQGLSAPRLEKKLVHRLLPAPIRVGI
jgi:hypothetical protein